MDGNPLPLPAAGAANEREARAGWQLAQRNGDELRLAKIFVQYKPTDVVNAVLQLLSGIV